MALKTFFAGMLGLVLSLPAFASDKDNEYDYVIVGNGTSGAVLARKLTNKCKYSVLVLEAGPNLSNDEVVLAPNVFPVINELSFDPKFAINYTIPTAGLLQTLAYGEGKMWGGSSAHNYLLSVRASPAIYDAWAAFSGNSRWSYNNLLPVLKSFETYTPDGTSANPAQRGHNGPIYITQLPPVDQDPYPQATSTVTHAPLVMDYNDATEGNTGVSAYQQFVTPGNNSVRSFSINGYLPESVVTQDGKGRNGRKLRIISEATASRIIFKGNKAKGVEYITTGDSNKVKKVYAKKKVILAAGAVQTPALLQRSGIGDSGLLASLGIDLVYHNPNVGKHLENQYGPIVVTSGGTPTNTQAMINGWPYFPDDDMRRIQYLNNGGLPVNFGYGFVLNPQSRGSVEIVSKNPFDRPRVDLGLFTDGSVSTPGTDAYTLVSFLKIVKDIATEAGEVVYLPTPADYTDDDTLLAYAQSNPNLIITSHITGTCRMAKSPADGVVDGNLQVFGVKNLMIVNLGVAPVQPDCNPCVSVYAIANEAARILGVE